MKKVLIAIAAIATLIGTPALAADNWTGWYAGGNIGYGVATNPFNIAGSETTTPVVPVVPNFAAFSASHAQGLNGFIGGGQVGYNYQFRPTWVMGFEADIQGSGARQSNSVVDPFSGPLCNGDTIGSPVCTASDPFDATASTTYESRIGWFGTVRGRLGALISDTVLLYGTAGLGYGQVSVSGNTIVNGSAGALPFTPGTSAFSASRINVGFAGGGGIEGKLSANWTWKLEYLYLDLGSLDTASPFPSAQPTPLLALSPMMGTLTTHTQFTDNIVRIGVNYQFGIGPAGFSHY